MNSAIFLKENGEMEEQFDYEQKANKIIEELRVSVFNFANIPTEETDDEEKPKKKSNKFYYNQIKPIITPNKVDTKLSQLLSVYRPLTEDEARKISDTDYLKGYYHYCEIILFINDYISFMPDKHTYCAFMNITTDIYNNFMLDSYYAQVFKSIDDKLVHSNFVASQSGMSDSKTILTKLQTKDAGYNLVRNAEAVLIAKDNKFDEQAYNLRLEKYYANLGIKKIDKK